ncbi:hypothetical protein OH76DRAFT_1407452 [Lentinus brumalis]|uniref:Uncharacterized protein n=1 Tax=Lentinus brumalis TaxID=2498619 RepID=A0A371D029_9APHY|nr:hypothetical protein OH76DRAFT_1407452 [Polyporus brumalis]
MRLEVPLSLYNARERTGTLAGSLRHRNWGQAYFALVFCLSLSIGRTKIRLRSRSRSPSISFQHHIFTVRYRRLRTAGHDMVALAPGDTVQRSESLQ